MRSLLPTLLTALFAPLLFIRCTAEAPAEAPATGLTFTLRLAPTLEITSRAGAEEPIAALWYALADASGRIIEPPHHKLSADCSQLTIEGLTCGDYALLLLATTDPDASAAVTAPTTLTDTWLTAPATDRPLDEAWFYRRLDLHIGAEQQSVAEEIVLERCVGRVDVELQLTSDYTERFIRSVELTFDQTEGLGTLLAADGTCRGAGGAGKLDLTASRSFLSLPSREPLSGEVRITAERSSGETFTRSCRFSDCRIEAGKIVHLAIPFSHPEDDEGMIRVTERDFARFACDTMLLADEPREIFYDNSRRFFYPNRPLQATIDAEHRLQLRFYSPVPIRDVTIRARFNRVSTEFFDLARFDLVYPFMEAAFPLPVTTGPKRFAAADGRRVTVPAQPDLTNDEVTLEVVCNDPFMQKIATINSNWLICFSKFGADEGHAYWRHMTPELCRHGVALALNMACMFASTEFNIRMERYKGKLTDNNGAAIDLDELRERIRTHDGLTLGLVTGVGGLGGGRTYGLADYCYREVYWDWDANQLANPHTYVRQAMFHEYGHCLGYSHDSTMTYGDQWTVLCAEVFVEMGAAGRLPVGSKTIIDNLPM